MRKGPGKSFIAILNAIYLEYLLDYILLKCDRTGSDDLGIGVLREFPYMP
jgi:hypothetical protein